MLIAKNQHGERIRPIKGGAGFCQICGNPVLAFCGNIYIHHWKHKVYENCDSWSEQESDWHRGWKEEFPEDWREVTLEQGGIKHIADVRTSTGLVLELQNSYLSDNEIEKRESFYNHMVWLINANNFKDNFKIWSVVKTKLRQLENNRSPRFTRGNKESKAVEHLKYELQSLRSQISSVESTLLNQKSSFHRLVQIEESIEAVATRYIEEKFLFCIELSGFGSVHIETARRHSEKIILLESDVREKKKQISAIVALPNCVLDNYSIFKHINYTDIKSASYSKCLWVERESVNSLFPEVKGFKSALEFEQAARSRKYDLIIDPSETLMKLEKEIDRLKSDILSILAQKKQLKRNIQNDLTVFLLKRRENATALIQEAETKLVGLQNEYTYKESELEQLKTEEVKESKKVTAQIENSYKENRREIMMDYKGLYGYFWKHRRKSWDVASVPIYFDFEDHIFERVNESELRKISKDRFLEIIKNG